MIIYQPAEDSYLLEKYVKKFSKNKSFLDMGSGTGIQSIAAINSNALKVLAIDINPKSIKELKKQNIPALKSNLFSNNKLKNKKFDIIAFNPPYLPRDKREDKESQLATTGGKRGDEVILHFLKQAIQYLNPKGIILLIISSQTPKDKIFPLIKKLNLKKSILAKKKLFMEELEVWKLSQ